MLCTSGINVNFQNPNGVNALMAAADNNHHRVVRELLKHEDVDVNAKDEEGNNEVSAFSFL